MGDKRNLAEILSDMQKDGRAAVQLAAGLSKPAYYYVSLGDVLRQLELLSWDLNPPPLMSRSALSSLLMPGSPTPEQSGDA